MKGRIEFLDVLRGVAALAVFASHLLYPIAINPQFSDGLGAFVRMISVDYFNWGRFGVVLFFLLSGFVIPQSFKGTRPVSTFLVGRFFRLYPAYWLSIIWTVAILFLVFSQSFPGLQLLANLTMIQKFLGFQDVNGVYWSLAIEIVFYALCIALCLAGALEKPLFGFLLFAIFMFATILPIAVNWKIGTRLPIQFFTHHLSFLFLGGLIRDGIYLRKSSGAMKLAWVGVGLALIGLPFACGLTGSIPAAQIAAGQEYAFIAGYVVAISVFVAGVIFKFSANSFWSWAGAISYSVYIFHFGALKLAEWIFPLHGVASVMAYLLAATSVTLVVAAAVYRYVELPFMDLGRHVRRRVDLMPLSSG
ncbi:acyltransferase family protein [Roseateles sp. BYS87W]|uniref:Acyltransferase family protein n=1 Tax=Pelomonas baiyunensis TaxID=3299026 RepID=A0ABW7H3H9_9BURK